MFFLFVFYNTYISLLTFLSSHSLLFDSSFAMLWGGNEANTFFLSLSAFLPLIFSSFLFLHNSDSVSRFNFSLWCGNPEPSLYLHQPASVSCLHSYISPPIYIFSHAFSISAFLGFLIFHFFVYFFVSLSLIVAYLLVLCFIYVFLYVSL